MQRRGGKSTKSLRGEGAHEQGNGEMLVTDVSRQARLYHAVVMNCQVISGACLGGVFFFIHRPAQQILAKLYAGKTYFY